MPPGAYRLWACADPLRGLAQIEATAFGHTVADITMAHGVFVVGTVRTADGTPVPDLMVAARTEPDPSAGHFMTTATRADGSFGLPCVQARRFVVCLERSSTVLASRQIEAAAPGVLRCDFVLADLQVLRGRVVDDAGRPLAGWSVRATDEAAAGQRAFARCDAHGRFELYLAGDRTFRLAVGQPLDSGTVVERGGVRCGAGEIELRVPAGRLPKGSVRGRLVDVDGHAVAGREVFLQRMPPAISTRSASDGSFILERVPAGEFDLRHRDEDARDRRLLEVSLAHGQHLDLGELAVTHAASIRVEVTRADGTPWRAALPGLRLLDGDGRQVEVDVDRGRELGVAILRAPDGAYRLVLEGADLIATTHDIELVAGQTRTLRCAVAIGRSRDLVFNGDGAVKQPDAALRVVVRTADGTIVARDDAVDLLPDLRGFRYWSFRHAYPFGRYEVEAHTDTGLRYRASFEVPEDLDDPTRIDVPAVGR